MSSGHLLVSFEYPERFEGRAVSDMQKKSDRESGLCSLSRSSCGALRSVRRTPGTVSRRRRCRMEAGHAARNCRGCGCNIATTARRRAAAARRIDRRRGNMHVHGPHDRACTDPPLTVVVVLSCRRCISTWCIAGTLHRCLVLVAALCLRRPEGRDKRKRRNSGQRRVPGHSYSSSLCVSPFRTETR